MLGLTNLLILHDFKIETITEPLRHASVMISEFSNNEIAKSWIPDKFVPHFPE